MAGSEAPATGESRREQLPPSAYRHRASRRLYKVGIQGSTRQENTRALARWSFDVSLVVVGRVPVYRCIAAEATQMRDAGASVKAIRLHFGVDHHTVEKAIRWFRQPVR